jgi:uncharacterized protein YerC
VVVPVSTEPTLTNAICLLRTEQEALDFIEDLLTPDEIETLEARWRIVLELIRSSDAHASQRHVARLTGRAEGVVGRMSRALRRSRGGVLEKIAKRLLGLSHGSKPRQPR